METLNLGLVTFDFKVFLKKKWSIFDYKIKMPPSMILEKFTLRWVNLVMRKKKPEIETFPPPILFLEVVQYWSNNL